MSFRGMRPIPRELEDAISRIRGIAIGYGLDPLDVVFQVVSPYEMGQFASYGGFPVRYFHWRFGMEFERLRKGHEYGLHRIYEMVINTDPSYAFLLESNTLTDMKLVVAHVFAHSDFFKNNLWFSKTDRMMLNEMGNHATRIERYIDSYGLERVETFIDRLLSLENLLDISLLEGVGDDEEGEREGERVEVEVPIKSYMRSYFTPSDGSKEGEEGKPVPEGPPPLPPHPIRDLLPFLLQHAPLEEWEQEILEMVIEEARYFIPQAQTKMMNEGWATFWHSKMMTEKVLTDGEIIDYADHHSSTTAPYPGILNPYKLGYELFREIEERWNRGRFGKEWEECDDMKKKASWDSGTGMGLEKIFEVRRVYNDLTFIDEFLTPEFCEKNLLYTYRYNKNSGFYEIESRDFQRIKAQLLFNLTNLGHPEIVLIDANFRNRNELYLLHRHNGVDLDLPRAWETLKNLTLIWKRPVNLETVIEEKRKLLLHDGKEMKEEVL